MSSAEASPPLSILVAALGGEGGGVLMSWIVEAARSAGRVVQATSVPGVAQRTGATSYYVEIGEPLAGDDGSSRGPVTRPVRRKVMSLVPMPGRVDVVLCSELLEAARALTAGFVSPERTTLIASTSRVYTTLERIQMGDGRYDAARVENAARTLAKQCFLLDLAALAEDRGTFISATLFGALAGSGVLPWPAEVSRAVIGEGRSATASLAGFDAAYDAVAGETTGAAQGRPADSPEAAPPALPDGSRYVDAPAELRAMVAHGHQRVCDFQDARYGQLYLERTDALREATDLADPVARDALTEACRRLALWMAYEDVARVADLKTRPERFARIRAEARVEPGQILKVTEYLKPRAEEIAAVLPVAIGRLVMRRVERGGRFPLLGRGINVRSNGVVGFYTLRLVAALRHLRRRSLRYQDEQAAIGAWTDAMTGALRRSPAFAAALAELPRVLKGYSDTQARGLRAYRRIMGQIVEPAIAAGDEEAAAARLREAVSAALADEGHATLDQVVAPPSRKIPARLEAQASAH